jgi:hypothetical protein
MDDKKSVEFLRDWQDFRSWDLKSPTKKALNRR